MTIRLKTISRSVLSAAMIAVGVLHFARPDGFVKIMPPQLPAPLVLVYASGLFEILGGAGLALARTRRAAAWGLIALYIAVFPANVIMAIHEIQPDGVHLPTWALWLRLPLQAVFIAWAYSFTRPRLEPDPPGSP